MLSEKYLKKHLETAEKSILIRKSSVDCLVSLKIQNVDGQLTALDLAANDTTFPVRLTAPHIVGVRSLLPSNIPVRNRDPARAKSPHDNRSR